MLNFKTLIDKPRDVQIKTIKDIVVQYIDSKWDTEITPYITVHDVPSKIREHVIKISTSIINTKWEIGYPGGSFVQAICDNDLSGAIYSADSINERLIKFYVKMLNNINA
jgi:hypothetical protein